MRWRAFLVVAGIATLAVATPARPASAAVYTVNTTADNASANCQGTGPCSVRGAVTEANRLTGPDTINVPAGSYTLNSQNLGDLPISSDITITGASAATTTIGGDGKNARIFRVFSANGKATISHLRLTFASVVSLPTVADRIGGIVLVDSGAALSLDHVRADNGQAVRGGGIAIRGGTADIAKSSIDNNHASQDGAGIINLGLAGAPAKLTLTDSTVASNTNGTASGVQSTGNTGNVVTVTRSTIAYNNAGSNGGTGLRNETGTLSVAGSILVENRGDGTPDNCGGTITNGGGNVENFNKCGFALHDVDNTSQQLLASLAVTTFETPVLPIPATSVAVNLAGTCTGADQRDLPRAQGLGCDAGAYEFDLAPDTSITSGPSGTVSTSSVSFTFDSDDPNATFQCKLDSGAFTTCSSPQPYSGLADGAHTFTVRAIDTGGQADPSPPSRPFTVDTTAPNTTITAGPTGPTTVVSPSFTFTSTEAGSTFQCKLDGPGATTGTYAACTTPRAYTNLAQGTYTFSVIATDPAGNPDPTAATRAFTVDTTAPDTTINTGPSGPSASTSATFTYSSTEAGSAFQCQMDTGGFTTCPSSYTGLAQGAHTFSVRATDPAGNTDATPATRAFTVDTVAPDTTVDTGPSGTVASTSATFTYSSTEAGSTFQCQMDSGGFTTCPSTYTGLTQGAHTFSVRATDAAGNTDATPATRAFIVDTVAPDTTINSGPSGPVSSTSATFTYSSTEAGSTFQCQMDTAGFTTCPSSYTGLAQGAHTFSVRATDPAGNTDATPATRAFTVDTIAPDTSITGGPTGATNNASPSFTFNATETATFECKLDGPGATTGSYGSCTSAKSYTNLADGNYVFSVRATDAALNTDATPATRSFTVDTAPPDTTINIGPSGVTGNNSPSFTFTASEAGATFQCRLDAPGAPGTFQSCGTPRSYANLADGEYTFSVRAIDPAGNTDPTPATSAFTVDTSAPDTTITSGPTGATNVTSPSFSFTSTEAGSTFMCKLDGPGATTGTYAACTTPRAYTNLAQGTYTFSVIATDPAGNPDPTAATRSFTVDTAAPDTNITGGPSGATNVTSPSFSFTSTEAGSTFECKLDGPGATTGTYGACTTPKAYGALADGGYTVSVRATDPASNTDATPATRAFTVDTAAPDTSITGGPNGPTNVTPSFTFSSTETGTFECKLDGPGATTGTYGACTTPKSYAGLADGAYTVSVRAIDTAGNVDQTPAARSFTVDTAAPDTTITSGPTGPTNITNPSFAFNSTEAGSTFQCKLDGPGATTGTYGACTTPRSYAGLADGAYTFSVRATDPAGNLDGTPATRAFTVDTAPPVPTIDSGPTGPIKVNTATFTFNAHDATATVTCALDAAAFAPCTSPATFNTLADGAHTFRVRATDQAGNQGNVTQGFTVDTAAPDTTISAGGPTGATNNNSPSFSFTSTETGTFECKLDGPGATTGTFAACTTPKSFAGLVDGAYTFSVRAIDPAGNVDGSPATRAFTVDTAAPDTTINSGPSSPINVTSATFTFTSTEAGSTFQCQMDAGGFSTCPANYTNLAPGAHTFSVRATDPAGNTDATPATRSFTVDTTPPVPTIDSGPTGLIQVNSATFTFNAHDATATVLCALDGGAFATCTSPKAYTSLADGDHTFRVRATDPAGNQGNVTQGFIVDTTAPDTTITADAGSATNDTTPTFSFDSTTAGATFACKLDGPGATTGAYAGCTPPKTYGPLAQGTYTFSVRATDQANNTDPTPDSVTFVVDTTAPTTTIDAGPSGPINRDPTFAFSSNEQSSTFECAINDNDYSRCFSPKTYGDLSEVEGNYTFSVRAIDAAGNVGSVVTRAFSVDTTRPLAPAIKVPAADALQGSQTVTLEGMAEPNATVEVFEGAVSKGKPAANAEGAWSLQLTTVPEGAHVYTATATDAAGNVSAASAPRTVAIDLTPPPADVISGPSGPTTETSPAFAFASTDTGSKFECKLDGPGAAIGSYGPCTSPASFSGLQPGEYVFSMRATDGAGNQTVKTRSFTVTTTQGRISQEPTPTPEPGKTVVIQPVSGKTLVKLPGSSKFEPVDVTRGIPNGSTVDTRKGKIRLFAIPKAGKPAESALFYQGIFKLKLAGGVTELQLVEALSCPSAGKAGVSAKKPKTRKLWGDGSGSFRTRGQYSAATVRGTRWLVQDSCGKTLTKVAKGVVEVQDFVKRKKILVRAPKSYTAKQKKR